MSKEVRVGVGVILEREGKILIQKRKGKHAPYFSIPGGHVEVGEDFAEAAIREIKEESGLHIESPTVIALTNNLETYKDEGIHTISVILHTTKFSGEPEILEPEKCDGWYWVDPYHLPEPHFEASRKGIACFLSQKFYTETD